MITPPTAGKRWPQTTGQSLRCTILLIILVALSPGCREDAAQAPAPTAPATSSVVGFRIFQWNYPADDGSSRPLNVAVWYPAQSTGKPVTYVNGVTGDALANAAPNAADAPYPLVVWSHGYTGSALAGAHLAEHLAAHGYVVAAIDHNDPVNPVRLTGVEWTPGDGTGLRLKRALDELLAEMPGLDHARHAYRPTELSLTLDHILAENADADSPLHGMIDRDRIGAGGHSMGGYTVMSLVGCLEGKRDPRIKVAVFHSPAAWMWRAADYERIAVPSFLMIGELEKGRPVKLMDIQRAIAHLPLGSYFLEVADADHATFSDLRGGRGRRNPAGDSWPTISPRIIRYTRAMFDLVLQDSDEAATILAEPGIQVGKFTTD